MTTTKIGGVLAAAAMTLTACGQDSPGKASGDPEAARIAFAKCMRDHGIDLPDPGPGPNQVVRIRGRVSPQKMEAAEKECAAKTGGGPRAGTPEQQQEFRDAAYRFTACMRRHGIDLPDPQVGNGKVIQAVPRGAGVNPNSARFKAAQQACQAFMPQPKGGATGP